MTAFPVSRGKKMDRVVTKAFERYFPSAILLSFFNIEYAMKRFFELYSLQSFASSIGQFGFKSLARLLVCVDSFSHTRCS
jgi:hypothetical protein